MTGKTHKFLGIVAGGAIAYYGYVWLGDPLYSMAVLSAPIGAMVSDIDHNNSKLGSSRKQVLDFLTNIFRIALPVVGAMFLLLGYMRGTLINSLITLVLVLAPFQILFMLTKINFVKKNLKFIVKHRGIMHTLIIPVFLYTGTLVVVEPVFDVLLKGLFAGYITHIFADMLTVRGCPVLYPFTKKNFRLAEIRTGSVWEYIAAGIISAGIVGVVFVMIYVR